MATECPATANGFVVRVRGKHYDALVPLPAIVRRGKRDMVLPE
jgi:hypothetical protein